MDELSRIIGSVETQLKSINLRMSEVEDKLDGIIADFNQRKGMHKILYSVCALIGATCGFLSNIITK
mgnify:CR=1 FL=1